MALFLILLLILAAAGVLGTVVKVALGVALGLVTGFILLGYIIGWRIRRAFYGGRRGPQWRRVRGSSTVEILHRPPEP